MEGNNNRSVQSKDCCNGSSNHIEQLEMHGKKTASDVNTQLPARRRSCLPALFERSRTGTLNPSFDSLVLEQHFQECFFPQHRSKFRSALVYVVLSCIVWIVFFAVIRSESNYWVAHVAGACSIIVVSAMFFTLTMFDIYSRHYMKASVVYALLLCTVFLLRYAYVDFSSPDSTNLAMSSIGSFCGLIQIILLLYNLLPLPFYLAILLSLTFSIVYEVLSTLATESPGARFVIGKVLLHVCLHLLCTSLYLMATVRKHSTFSRIGQSTRARRALKREKLQQDNLIFSLMPEKVAKAAIRSRNDKQEVRVCF